MTQVLFCNIRMWRSIHSRIYREVKLILSKRNCKNEQGKLKLSLKTLLIHHFLTNQVLLLFLSLASKVFSLLITFMRYFSEIKFNPKRKTFILRQWGLSYFAVICWKSLGVGSRHHFTMTQRGQETHSILTYHDAKFVCWIFINILFTSNPFIQC